MSGIYVRSGRGRAGAGVIGQSPPNRSALRKADLNGAYLSGTNLRRADLCGTNIHGTNLIEANLASAAFRETVLSNLDLSSCKALESCTHAGPSIIDIRTLQRSGPLPLEFLRGVGVPDTLIEYLPSLRNQAIQYYSCFISYSTKDQLFADRLHADLQNRGVRCWFAPHDLPTGAKTWNAIDEAIRLREKLLLVLSKASLASAWVEDEVSKSICRRARAHDYDAFSDTH